MPDINRDASASGALASRYSSHEVRRQHISLSTCISSNVCLLLGRASSLETAEAGPALDVSTYAVTGEAKVSPLNSGVAHLLVLTLWGMGGLRPEGHCY